MAFWGVEFRADKADGTLIGFGSYDSSWGSELQLRRFQNLVRGFWGLRGFLGISAFRA